MSKIQRLARNHFDAVVYKQITAMQDWIDARGVHRYVCSHPDLNAPSIRQVDRSLTRQAQAGIIVRRNHNGVWQYKVR